MFDIPDKSLQKALLIISEAAKLKTIIRQSFLVHADRFENSAEHSWHLTFMALMLEPYANEPVNLLKVIKMLILHDLGEITTGDTYLYDDARDHINIEEQKTIENLFKSLGASGRDFVDLWIEFEARQTPEAKFAAALDRFQPFMKMLENGGESWRRYGITLDQALDKNKHIKDGSDMLWQAYEILAKEAAEKGYFKSCSS